MIRVSFKNKFEGATASSQAERYSTDNLLDTRVSSKWQSGDTFSTAHYLQGTFITPTAISCIGLLGIECTPGATITLTLKLGSTIKALFVFTGADIIYGYGEGPYGLTAYGGYAAPGRTWAEQYRVKWFDLITVDNWRLDIDQLDYTPCKLGGLFFGEYWQAPIGKTVDSSVDFASVYGDIQRNRGNIVVGPISVVNRKLSTALTYLTEDDVLYWNNNMSADSPVLFSSEAGDNTTSELFYTIYGYLTSEISFMGSKAKRFNATIAIDEVK